jgi:hypothetical protein
VRGRLPGDTLEVTAWRYQPFTNALVKDGIDRIAFEAATFDLPLDRTGYASFIGNEINLPFRYRPFGGLPTVNGPPASGQEFLHVSADIPTLSFHVRGQLGRLDSAPSSQLHRLLYSETPCVNPKFVTQPDGSFVVNPLRNRVDFPHLPVETGTSHKCIAADFDGDTGANPMSLQADVNIDPETTIRLRDGGISDLPAWFQVNIADAQKFQDTVNQRGWRAPCGPESDTTADNCMAPLMRFDQSAQSDPSIQNVLFGSAEIGDRDDLDDIRDVDPTTVNTLNFDAIPTATGWIGENNLTNDRGALVRLVDFPDETDPTKDPYSKTRLGISASIRLPIPQSLTVDTPQEYEQDLAQRTTVDKHIVGGAQAKDLRIRIVVRDAFGNILSPTSENNLGDVALYKARQDRNAELLIGAACAVSPIYDAFDRVLGVLPTFIAEQAVEIFGALVCPEWQQGIGLPGELGFTLYQRTSYTDLGGDKLRTSNLFQIDGRLSSPISAAIRMREAGGTIPSLAASVYDVPGFPNGVEPSDPSEPTFRLRAEMVGDDKMPKDSEPKDNSSTHEEEADAVSFVMTTEFEIGAVKADFDFRPTSDAPARQVDAVIYTNISDLNVGVDIHGFQGIGEDTPPAEIDAHVSAQIKHLKVEGFTKWNLPIDDILEFVPNWLIENLLPGDSWVEDALTWLVSVIADGISAVLNGVLNLLPVGFAIEGRIDVNLNIDELHTFTYRQSLLRGFAEVGGDGDADIGSINLFLNQLSAGLHLDLPDIPLPTALLNALIDAFECIFSLFSDCDSDEHVPESIDLPPVMLFGWGFMPTGQNFTPFIPVLLDFRACNISGWSGAGGAFVDFLGSLVPLGAGGLDNAITVTEDEEDVEFAIWPGTDPRISLTGVIPTVFPVLQAVLVVVDWIVDLIAGPILCLGFDADPGKFQAANYGGDLTTYNPGGIAASSFVTPDTAGDAEGFAGHGVPGQPGEPLFQPPASDLPDVPAQNQPDPIESTPTVIVPPEPTPVPPLYSGLTGATINSNVAMCGIHEYDTLTINGNITVATAANATQINGRDACLLADVGQLEFRANELAVNGNITANAISTDVDLDGEATAFRATGNSGGTNAGSGYDGAAPSAAIGPYTNDLSEFDTHVTAGGPGSAIPDGYTRDGQTGPITGDDDFGLGGGAIRLRADTLLVLDGELSANGEHAEAGDLAGTCDDDPDDNGTPGLQQHHEDNDGDPDTPIENDTDDDEDEDTPVDNDDADEDNPDEDTPVDNDVLDPPTDGEGYEHTGTMGAGGGAGGGILLEARIKVQVLGGGDVSAQGGNGGDGFLGAGGGGGGGVIRVVAPVVDGITESDVDGATHAGLNGDPATSPCDLVPVPTENTYDSPDTDDGDPDTTDDIETLELPEDGFGRIASRPFARLEGYGPFWWRGNADFTGYVTGGGGPNQVQVVACAVYLPDSGTDSPFLISQTASELLPTRTVDVNGDETIVGAFPTPSAPCGSRGGSDIRQLTQPGTGPEPLTFTGAVAPPSDSSKITLRGTDTGYYAMYTTALRPKTAGNNCLSTSDDTSFDPDISDATDCAVEDLDGIEWVVGIDSTAPAVPSADFTINSGVVDIASIVPTFTATDAESGVSAAGTNVRGLCRVRHILPAGGPADPDFTACVSTQAFAVPPPGGIKILDMQVADGVGNLSPVQSRAFIYNVEFPEVTATLDGGTLGGPVGNQWYTTVPEIDFTGYDSFTPPADVEYAYQFDNGLEKFCNSTGVATEAPYADRNCTVPSSELANLVPGLHTLFYSAIDETGRRYTGADMPSLDVPVDNKGPLVEITPVGRPDVEYGGLDYYSYQPRVFVSAIDQFGASGIDAIEYAFGGPAGTYTEFDPADPPLLPLGETVVCGRATDVAGNQSDNDPGTGGNQPACATLLVDHEAPTLDFTQSGGTLGANPDWYVEAPSFAVSNYDDLPNPGGVGIDDDHFRVRSDNRGYSDCDAPAGCSIAGSTFDSGRHLVHASAADRFENRSTETLGTTSYEFLLDLEDPRVEPIISPRDPDGANGWWVTNPWLTLFGDDGDGSGIDALFYTLDGTINGSPDAAFIEWTVPVQTGPGDRELCWYGVDVAGRDSDVECQAMQVDLADPTADVTAPAGPFDGWHDGPVTATSSADDALPGSGIGPDGDPAHRCLDLSPDVSPAPSGRCISVDGGPYVPITGPVTGSVDLGEGDHVVRTFSIDESGRRSAVDEQLVRIDMSRPVVAIRLLPPEPAQNNWYRYRPYVVLRASDGRDGSGIIPGSFEYQIDATSPTGWIDYIEPFQLQQGVHTVHYRASDLVGERSGSETVRIDTTSPVAVATTPQRTLWLRLLGLGQPTNALNYTLRDNLSGPVHTWVVIFDVTGNPVRMMDGGIINVVPGAGPVTRSVLWDGKTGSLTDLVPLGVYYYRVVAVDEAGNWTQSGESTKITIRLL